MPLGAEQRTALADGIVAKVVGLSHYKRRTLTQRLEFDRDTDISAAATLAELLDDTLIDLADYFEVDATDDDLWPESGVRLFVSHVANARNRFEQLKTECALYGANFFLAHDNIEEGAEWRASLLRALDSMDAFVTVHSADFAQSPWTNQEAGYALARKVPIVPILDGETPSGFLGSIQGYRWRVGHEKALTSSILNKLNEVGAIPARLGESLARTLKTAENFNHSDLLVEKLCACREITENAVRAINLAFHFNEQVYNSGAEERLSDLLERFGAELFVA